MKQIIQDMNNGNLSIHSVPRPAVETGWVLVENAYSLISAGTEKSTVQMAQESLLGKAQKRPDLVKQVFDTLRREGLRATIRKVQTKLNAPKALGYSSAGVVIASMDTNNRFKPGDRVACAGQDYASHAEVIAVPQNLVVKVPETVDLKEASFTTLGAIALQGIRQARLSIGERVCVIGLGLLGQITAQLIEAQGCSAFGIDVSSEKLDQAIHNGLKKGVVRTDETLAAKILAETNGFGFDAVIITAATKENDPVVLAGELVRKKGRVVIVGDVRMDIPRNPHYYRKEIDIRMACSYGPGRYDPHYEEYGQDYPLAYVRWTEARNMEAFLTLIAEKKIALHSLITHEFPIDEALRAYDLILGKTKKAYNGIILSYPQHDEKHETKCMYTEAVKGSVVIGCIGAGTFAQNNLLPYIKKSNAVCHTVVTQKGVHAEHVARKFGFSHASTNADDILHNDAINTVFIATRHDSHGAYVLEALKKGKHVFVEKPLVLHEKELDELVEWHEQANVMPYLCVGYNRRFSPAVTWLKKELEGKSSSPVITYRVNAGAIPADHWIQQPHIGGGRIIGEVCHFVDVLQYVTGAKPVRVYAAGENDMQGGKKPCDDCLITMQFDTGALGSIAYTAKGNTQMPKEQMEVFIGGDSYVVDNFKGIAIYKNGKKRYLKKDGKGHCEEVNAFIAAIRTSNEKPLVSFESLVYTSRTTFRIIDALRTGLPQEICFYAAPDNK